MGERLRRFWPWLKLLLFAVVLVGVGWHLIHILQNEELQHEGEQRSPAEVLWDATRQANPLGLSACAGLYLLGLGFSAGFWVWLVRFTGQPMAVVPAVRGYYI